MIYASNHNEFCCKYLGQVPYQRYMYIIFECSWEDFDYLGVNKGDGGYFHFNKKDAIDRSSDRVDLGIRLFYNTVLDMIA